MRKCYIITYGHDVQKKYYLRDYFISLHINKEIMLLRIVVISYFLYLKIMENIGLVEHRFYAT